MLPSAEDLCSPELSYRNAQIVNMEAVSSSETSETIYPSTRRPISEDLNRHNTVVRTPNLASFYVYDLGNISLSYTI